MTHQSHHDDPAQPSRTITGALVGAMFAARAEALGERLREVVHVEALLDGTVDSITRLELVIQEFRGELLARGDIPVGVGAYIGEVVRARLDGQWTSDGRLIGIGPRRLSASPVETARRRLREGMAHHLVLWTEAVLTGARVRAVSL